MFSITREAVLYLQTDLTLSSDRWQQDCRFEMVKHKSSAVKGFGCRRGRKRLDVAGAIYGDLRTARGLCRVLGAARDGRLIREEID